MHAPHLQMGRLRLGEFKQPAHCPKDREQSGFQPRRLAPSPGPSPGLTFNLVNDQQGSEQTPALGTEQDPRGGGEGWGWGAFWPESTSQTLGSWVIRTGVGPTRDRVDMGCPNHRRTPACHRPTCSAPPRFPGLKVLRSQRGIGRELEAESVQGLVSASASGAPGNGRAWGQQLLKV